MLFEGAFGFRTLVPQPHEMKIDTVFDLSSLTKVLATTIAAMMLVRDAKLKLDDRVMRFFPDFGVHGKRPGHTSPFARALLRAFAAWRPFLQTHHRYRARR